MCPNAQDKSKASDVTIFEAIPSYIVNNDGMWCQAKAGILEQIMPSTRMHAMCALQAAEKKIAAGAAHLVKSNAGVP
eukprot:scaffold2009_cov20-Tisochrysis_lutea.AAC.1